MEININRAMFPTITTERDWMPPGSSPYLHDAFNMGVQIGSNVTIMMGNFDTKECPYLYVIDTRNGHRIKISFDTEGEITNG